MKGWLRSAAFGIPSIVLIVVVCLLAMPFCATCGGHDEVVTELVTTCKRATDLLGEDAHPARMGVACGSTESSGGNGNASWALPYTGSRGRGTVSFDAIKRGGEWHVDRATLEVGDDAIDLVACARGSARPAASTRGRLSQTNADAANATFSGKAIRSTHATIAVGGECTGSLDRERGSPTAHVRVNCRAADGAEAVLTYEGRGAFTLDVRDGSRPDDDRIEYDDSGNSATKCRISSADGKGTLTVWSTSPAWELVVEL